MSNPKFKPLEHLEKYGWRNGAGLGKEQHGIKEAIKVKLKFDTAGVGHDIGEQFTHHWWEKAFNSAAKSIEVKENEDGILLNKTGDYHVSTKKTSKSALKNAALYGGFVKAATLTDGAEESVCHSSDDSSDSEAEFTGSSDKKSSFLSDEQLFEICGGRTAHKGARHGLKLNGKLARIAEQETSLVNGCRSASNTGSDDSESDRSKTASVTLENNSTDKKKKKKSKHKERKVEHSINGSLEEAECDNSEMAAVKKKKKKQKKSKDNATDRISDITEKEIGESEMRVVTVAVERENNPELKPKKEKKSKKKNKEKANDTMENECIRDSHAEIKDTKKTKKRKTEMEREKIPDNIAKKKHKKS